MGPLFWVSLMGKALLPFLVFSYKQLKKKEKTPMTWCSLRQLYLEGRQWHQRCDTECICSFEHRAQQALCNSERNLEIVPEKEPVKLFIIVFWILKNSSFPSSLQRQHPHLKEVIFHAPRESACNKRSRITPLCEHKGNLQLNGVSTEGNRWAKGIT